MDVRGVSICALGLLAIAAPVANAQQQSPQPPPAGVQAAARSFDAASFSAYNPVTAEDMVRRVPGFTLDSGDDRRGFAGAGGNVLINGERPSSKTPLAEQLARISARDVLRIDLYAGGSDGADLRGQTQYLDVRLRPRTTRPTNTFVVQATQLDPSDTINPVVNVTSAFQAGPASVSLALQAQPSRRGRIEYRRRLFTPGGAILESAEEFLQGSYREYRFSGRIGWKPDDANTFNANLQVTPSRDGRHTFASVTGPTGAPLRVEDSRVVGDEAMTIEVGGDWERKLAGGSSFKLVGLTATRNTGSSERYTVRPSAGPRRDTLIQRASESGESVGRATLTLKPSDLHTLNFGAEAAFNFLDSELDIRVATPAGTINATPPVANTRVEELRLEASFTDFWQVRDNLRVEAGLTAEASRISQTGDAQQERDFTYLKPRFAAAWTASPTDQVRFLFERDVAQLDFTEFASAVSLFDGTQDIGNPDLEPERTWRLQADWERRFGPKAVVSLSLFHDWVEAVQDQIPIAGQFDGPGNIGDGRRAGVQLDATAPLDALGLPRAELRLTGKLQTSEVDDPVTGEARRFSDEPEWSYSVDFRQPIPSLKLLWGVLYERADDIPLFRFRELRTTEWQDPNIDIYVETTAIAGLVIRLTYADILLPDELRERQFFSPDRAQSANPSSIEQRFAQGAYGTRSIGIRVAGRF